MKQALRVFLIVSLVFGALWSSAEPAVAKSIERTVQVTCQIKKNKRVKKDVACVPVSATVTEKGSKAFVCSRARGKAFRQVPRSGCLRSNKWCTCVETPAAGADGPPNNSGGGDPGPEGEPILGMSRAHADGLAAFAKENKYTIIVRASNPDSVQYQDKDQSKFRPKPLTIKDLKTAKTGSNVGLLARPSAADIKKVDDPKAYKKDATDEIKKLTRKCKKVTRQEVEQDYCGWSIDKDGLLRDSKGRAVYGDYDLQGVYKKRKLLTSNPLDAKGGVNKKGEKLLKKLNQALDPKREGVQRLFQHGAQDNFRKYDKDRKIKMGRKPGKKEQFLVFEADGNIRTVKSTKKLQKYYEENKMKWLYEDYK